MDLLYGDKSWAIYNFLIFLFDVICDFLTQEETKIKLKDKVNDWFCKSFVYIMVSIICCLWNISLGEVYICLEETKVLVLYKNSIMV